MHEKERAMSESQGKGMMAGFIFGAVVGAGVALLVAPASGSETRKRIKEKALELRGKSEELKTSARGKLDEIGQAVRGGAREVTSAVKEGRDAFLKAAEDSKRS
jgi:gas vesicle protein